MSDLKKAAEFSEVRRHWATNEDDSLRSNYMGMTGRISAASLLAHMATIAPHVKPEQMMLNWATVVWHDESTEEERQEREEQRARQQTRTEEWERKTLARLKAKYEPNAVSL